jgi:hypothetical protein
MDYRDDSLPSMKKLSGRHLPGNIWQLETSRRLSNLRHLSFMRTLLLFRMLRETCVFAFQEQLRLLRGAKTIRQRKERNIPFDTYSTHRLWRHIDLRQ